MFYPHPPQSKSVINLLAAMYEQAIYVSKFAYVCFVEKRFEKYKGIHPGLILERELKKRNIGQRPFALAIDIAPQSFNQFIKAKRVLPVSTALKADKELELEHGTLALLQTYYEIEKAYKKIKKTTPDLSIIRKSLFWDTDIDQVDWSKQYASIIKRVFERGNDLEKKEITKFYGNAKIKAVISKVANTTNTIAVMPHLTTH